MLLDKYPGLTRGLARLRYASEVQRTAAMLPFEEVINTVPVLRLTPRHIDQLLLVQTPYFYVGRERQPEHAAQFLWVISPSNPLNQATWLRCLTLPLRSLPRRLFMRRLRRMAPHRYYRFNRAIDRYLDRMTLDQPPRGSSGRVVPVAFSVSIVNRIAAAYHWPDEVLDIFRLPILGKGILDMPVPRLYQYWRWIQTDRDGSTPLFSKLTDAFRIRLIGRWQERAKAAGFGTDVERYLIFIGKLPSTRSPAPDLDPAPNPSPAGGVE